MTWNRYQFWVTERSKTTNYSEQKRRIIELQRTKPQRKTTINVELWIKCYREKQIVPLRQVYT